MSGADAGGTKLRFAAALAGILAFLAVAFGLVGAMLWGDLDEAQQRFLGGILEERVGLLIYLLAMVAAVIGLILHQAFRGYVHPPRRLAEQVRVLVDAQAAPGQLSQVSTFLGSRRRRTAHGLRDVALLGSRVQVRLVAAWALLGPTGC